MEKIKSVLSIALTITVVILGLFIFIKGSVFTIWISQKTPETFSIDGADGRSIKIIFLPENKAIMWYKDATTGAEEYNLVEMKGTYGTHYFWNLWHIEGPGITFGYRLYSEGTEPVVMETKTLQKYMKGKGDQNFSPVGKVTYSTYLFQKNAIRFQDMWLQKEDNDYNFISRLMSNLN